MTLDERGKLRFPETQDILENERLRKIKKYWESFALEEDNEREQYLRSLEVQFSMNSMVEASETEAVTDFITGMFADKKVEEQESSVFQHIEEARYNYKRVTDK